MQIRNTLFSGGDPSLCCPYFESLKLQPLWMTIMYPLWMTLISKESDTGFRKFHLQIHDMKIHSMLCLTILLTGMNLSIERLSHNDVLAGAWASNPDGIEHVLLFADGYFTHTTFDKTNKKFFQTRGGPYTYNNEKLTILIEFDTKDSMQVGQSISYKFKVKDDGLKSDFAGKEITFKRIDDGNSGLHGLWKITGRRQDGEMRQIHQTGTRKTIKILTATRFQWAAIDPGTKQFMGTGGGSYTFKDGKYTEHIEFFSRDNSRVGSSLVFDGKLENGDWHHSGLSSRGDPIYEIWSRK